MKIQMSSTAFGPGGPIPRRYTCEGENVSPPLTWVGVPTHAKSLALIVDDPDAPDPAAPRRTWVHWILYNIPATVTELPEACNPQVFAPPALDGVNDWSSPGYRGPCPPIGRHRYFHKLYALDEVLPDLHHPDKPRLLAALKGHVLAEAALIGTYQKSRVE